VVSEIPEFRSDATGALHSTTLSGKRPRGRLILYTSRENMPNAYKVLRPRWKISYRASQQMIGSKLVSELAPTTPGAQHIYATVELSALEPGYVDLGRKRPLDGPLVQALDIFVSESIRILAEMVNNSRRQQLDAREIDRVCEENNALNSFKNRFLPGEWYAPDEIEVETGAAFAGAVGKWRDSTTHPEAANAKRAASVPTSIEIAWNQNEELRVGCGVTLPVAALLKPHVKDAAGRTVQHAELEWHSGNQSPRCKIRRRRRDERS
jgi:hypothetical protein